MRLNGKITGLAVGALAAVIAIEPLTLMGKLACVVIGGGAGAKFGETCEAEYYRIKSSVQEKEIERLKAEVEAAKA